MALEGSARPCQAQSACTRESAFSHDEPGSKTCPGKAQNVTAGVNTEYRLLTPLWFLAWSNSSGSQRPKRVRN